MENEWNGFHSMNMEWMPIMGPQTRETHTHTHTQFITVQLSGSHWNYVSRYPEEFAKFKTNKKKMLK